MRLLFFICLISSSLVQGTPFMEEERHSTARRGETQTPLVVSDLKAPWLVQALIEELPYEILGLGEDIEANYVVACAQPFGVSLSCEEAKMKIRLARQRAKHYLSWPLQWCMFANKIMKTYPEATVLDVYCTMHRYGCKASRDSVLAYYINKQASIQCRDAASLSEPFSF